MKVLLIGSKLPHAIENFFVKYLQEQGVDVIHYAAPDIVLQKTSKTIFHKGLKYFKIYTGHGKINRELLTLAKYNKPDIIWIFKGMEIYADTIKELKKNSFLVNYNPDHPFLVYSRGGGNNNILRNFRLYNVIFCYQKQLIDEIKTKYEIEAYHLPFAFDSIEVVYTPFNQIEEIKKICFQANPDPLRIEVVGKIADAGIEIDLYGFGWESTTLKNHDNIRIFTVASRSDFWKINQQYRVQLNMFRQHNEGAHNLRTFEIPANGGIQLLPHSKEQEDYFENNKEVFYYHNVDELIEKAKYLLALPSEEALKIREAAYNRSMKSGYTFKDRTKQVYEVFKEIVKKK